MEAVIWASCDADENLRLAAQKFPAAGGKKGNQYAVKSETPTAPDLQPVNRAGEA